MHKLDYLSQVKHTASQALHLGTASVISPKVPGKHGQTQELSAAINLLAVQVVHPVAPGPLQVRQLGSQSSQVLIFKPAFQ